MRRAIVFGASGLRLGDRKMAPQEAEQYLRFIIHLFQSFEAPHVSRVMLQLVKIQLWYALSEPRREIELVRHPEAASYWKKMSRKDGKAAKKAKEQVCPPRAAVCCCTSGSLRPCRVHAYVRACLAPAGLPAVSCLSPGHGPASSGLSIVWLCAVLMLGSCRAVRAGGAWAAPDGSLCHRAVCRGCREEHA